MTISFFDHGIPSSGFGLVRALVRGEDIDWDACVQNSPELALALEGELASYQARDAKNKWLEVQLLLLARLLPAGDSCFGWVFTGYDFADMPGVVVSGYGRRQDGSCWAAPRDFFPSGHPYGWKCTGWPVAYTGRRPSLPVRGRRFNWVLAEESPWPPRDLFDLVETDRNGARRFDVAKRPE